MDSFSDKLVLETLAEMHQGSFQPENGTLPEEVQRYMRTHIASLTVVTVAWSIETEITGKNLPTWIKPFHFEENLHAALDALEAVEMLLAEHRQLLLIEMQHRFLGRSLRGTELAEHRGMVEQLSLRAYRQNLVLRLTKRLTELLEYGKAAKLAARLLFRWPVELIEFGVGSREAGELGINRLRESLRGLLTAYRREMMYEQEVTLPVSLKSGRNGRSEHLVARWGPPPDKRGATAGLALLGLDFDLGGDFGIFERFSAPRLRRIGVQVIDSASGIVSPAGTESDQLLNFWRVELRDEGGGMSLGYWDGSAPADSVRLDPMLFADVPGSRNHHAISWSRQNMLLNFHPGRKWHLEIDLTSHAGANASMIRDIILHFHIAYVEKTQSS